MKGSIKKDKKTGNFYFVVDIGKDATGKRIQKKKRGFESKQDAEIGLAKFLSEHNFGEDKKLDSDMIFSRYMGGGLLKEKIILKEQPSIIN